MGSSTSSSSSIDLSSHPSSQSGIDDYPDSFSSMITCHRMNGDNYLEWSQSVKIFLLGRERLGYITGDAAQPASTASGYAKWLRENGQVMTWLLRSMSPTISWNFLLYQSAATMWAAVEETYSSNDNIAEIYHIEAQAVALKQNNMPTTLYFNSFHTLWRQADLFSQLEWAVPGDAALYQKIIAQRRLFQFLFGLNKVLDEVSGRILAMSLLPSPREAFSMVKKEESRRNVMLSAEQPALLEGSALLTHQSSGPSRKGRPWCDHCKRAGHTKDRCWKLHGKPSDLKSKVPNSNLAAATTVTSFTPAQIADLQKFFGRFQGPCEGNLVVSEPEGTSVPTSLFSSQLPSHWILDSGATDHMTGNKAFFHSFFPTSGKAVKTTDDSLCNIEGYVVFTAVDCTLQALHPMKTIGRASLQNGLYLLSFSPPDICQSFAAYEYIDPDKSDIQLFKSDNGTEYFARALGDFFRDKGIVQLSSCVGTPQQNGVAERKNRHLLEAAIQGERSEFQPCIFVSQPPLPLPVTSSYLHSSKFPLSFVNDFSSSSLPHVNNISEFNSSNMSQSNHTSPEIHHSNISPANTPTLIPNSPNTNPPKHLQVYIRKQKHIPTAILQSGSCQELDFGSAAEIDGDMSKSSSALDDFPIAIRKGVRNCTKHPIQRFAGYGTLMPSFQTFTASLDKEQVPTSIDEALKDPKWRKAVKEEVCALEKNETWTITDLPQGKKTVGCKWIFVVKYNSNGGVERYKARLVARGFTQTYGLDFIETFAPVAKLNTVRVLLSLAVNCDWRLHQLDVKNAFLNGKLEEEVYMKVPPGLQHIEGANKVCKLNKSLYGLKQSPRAWFERFTAIVLKNGYKQSLADHTLFIKVNSIHKRTILIVYVDDIILTGDDEMEISNFKKFLNKEFEIKDLGKLRYFLGMEVARSKDKLVINQRKYVLDLLKETGFLGCKPVDTPMEANLKFNKEGGALVDKHQF
ncbi:hypothetical protein V6N11_058767 [Hibiscus sabdariffa]|uniref:Integrase catalytic domain-containing protein n=1 Tax=Hibiscus sabdariffa TaxID=183260 RepID=A0ABR2U560_9ROSI